MFHKSEILKNAVSERWCSDSSHLRIRSVIQNLLLAFVKTKILVGFDTNADAATEGGHRYSSRFVEEFDLF